ncbi:MAG: UDP-N-acetylglucosamine 2-epimerase, partial [Bacteroidetes bacterium]|nr:UDP-N-acetylglucosamine 2-epimerase [Bacteroidota bacterium]
MNISLLTSSRADYGIYLPLVTKISADTFFNLNLIVFGTHLSKKYGYTLDQIIQDGFTPKEKIETAPDSDDEESISLSMSRTFAKFSALWADSKGQPDLVIVLGDRYEMFAAVA